MLLTKQNLAVLAATDSNEGDFKSVVKLEPTTNRLIATNCAMMLISDLSGALDRDKFPETDKAWWTNPESSLIPARALEKAGKNIKKSRMPILECIAVEMSETGHCLTTTDLDTTDTIKTRPTDINYPDIDLVIETVENQVETESYIIAINILEAMLKAAKQHGAKTLKFTSSGATTPIKIETADNPGLTGYLMPYITEKG
ncbi:MAG: hypothetical protein RQ856_06420 [Candidatus Izemoplasmatales bacterium]|nr:hypothetical protein [Candidatus Izemoplasmatales bacterium]